MDTESFLNEDLNLDNYYSMLPLYINHLIQRNVVTKETFLDICFAICVSDENVGTNQRELDIDRFLVPCDSTWESVLSILTTHRASNGVPELPRVQRARVICDSIIISMQLGGYPIRTNYTSEASKKVVLLLNAPSCSSGGFNGSEVDVVNALKEIKNLLSSSKEVDKYRDILQIFKYLSKFKVRLDCKSPIYLPTCLKLKIRDLNNYSNIFFSDEAPTPKCDIYRIVNSTVLMQFNSADNFAISFLILDLKRILSKRYVLSVDYDTYKKVNQNIKLINALNGVFIMSNEVNESVLSTLILVLLYACPRRHMFRNILTVIKDGAYV